MSWAGGKPAPRRGERQWCVVASGAVFSFWRRWVLRGVCRLCQRPRTANGCVIPAVVRAVQLSNALYGCALDAGFNHCRASSAYRCSAVWNVPQGRDATVFWNYIDLRSRGKSLRGKGMAYR